MLDDLSEGDSPKIEAAANMARNHAIRLTAACHVIAEDHHAVLRVMLVFTFAHFALGHDTVVRELLHWTMSRFAVTYVLLVSARFLTFGSCLR